MNNITKFKHMSSELRQYMLSEIEYDLSYSQLYISSRLTNVGRDDYPNLLKEAVNSHDENWFAVQLTQDGRLNHYEQGRGMKPKRVPSNAHTTLAESQFNLYYMRGLCVYADSQEMSELVVCRYKDVRNPRSSSNQILGDLVSVQDALNDLRLSWEQQVLQLLKPNSGLTLCLPDN